MVHLGERSIMQVLEVHRFELRSHDERDLRNRLRTFRHAVHARDGFVLDICWAPQTAQGQWIATVVYELPSDAEPDDAA